MLAHKAMEEAVICVERLAGVHSHFNYDCIPAIVIRTRKLLPLAKTEEQLKEAGVEYRKGVGAYGANGRARTLGDIEGRVKILADAKTDRVLGVHIIGARAGDLIAEAAVSIELVQAAKTLLAAVMLTQLWPKRCTKPPWPWIAVPFTLPKCSFVRAFMAFAIRLISRHISRTVFNQQDR